MIALSLALIALPLQTADTSTPSAAVESPYTIRSGALELGGTVTVPRDATGRVPVVVIISGSGPTDRNGNSMMGIRPNSYAQLAWRLAERGIASLPYDTRFSRVMLLGHSEGSSLALIAARQGAPVVGVISVSGLGRPLGVVMREQLARQFDSATLVRYDTAMAQYLRGEQPKDVPPQLGLLFVPINLSFMKSLSSFDPPAAMRAVRQPVLIVQGGRDLQVTVVDAERLHTAKPDAQLVVVPLANHVLKQTTDTTLQGQMPTYQNPTVPIMPDVANAIADWILKLRS